MSKGTILVIDDEKDLIDLVRYNLEKEGYDVIAASDGQAGLDVATRHRPDLVVLDLMMPGIDGLQVCQRLRADQKVGRIPVIMLTAKATEADRIVGLELGADDYITKPFSPREVVARVKAVLRRASAQQEAPQIIRTGDLVIDLQGHEVTSRGQRVTLTATEFKILQFLASRPGRVFSRDEILDAALGNDAAVFDRTVDVHITAIRRKLGSGAEQIETVRGFGYKFRTALDA
ncbi:MAG: response regulator with CheY-like receiver domain and winged-helix DNA-binding domain [Phycisphaerales bacterium]|jgi:two-component system phosphate regulon response regulator PhoB|nr:response regulator with CheY-like receiver domain and winged-helix DNA-binding domain [Phycisphaerales bacterium]MDB5298786.1 response regulator with CheY-like receiver domain and winged-helix DNA-binding domain [Phycisphaerales bacterium]MDB5304295.1 response regulator with CheY-like receiver domain and winged-helix DNA-binding domain [Phycisphaerales bacterium]